jgi:hypothetical protein
MAWSVCASAGADELASARQDQIRRWIDDWDQSSFAARRAASQQLEGAGAEAFGLLADAAIERGKETAHRALEILARGLGRANSSVNAAAKESLQRIAASNNDAAARAAQEVLRDNERPAKGVAMAWQFNGPGGLPRGVRGIAVNGGQIIIPQGMPGWPGGVPNRTPFPNGPPVPRQPGLPLPWPGGPGGNPEIGRRALQAELRNTILQLDQSIARTRDEIRRTNDQAERARLNRRLEQSEELRRRLQIANPFR